LATLFILQEEETPEVEKKVQSSFKVISNYFVDPQKAEENLQKIHQMKDENVFTALSTLLDPCTSIDLATTVRVRLIVRGACDFLNVTRPFVQLLYSSVMFLLLLLLLSMRSLCLTKCKAWPDIFLQYWMVCRRVC